MSYALARYRRRDLGLGIWPFNTDTVYDEDNAEQKRCVDKANAAPQVTKMEGEVRRLRSDWNPTGIYRPTEIRSIITLLKDAAAVAGAALKNAPMSTRDAEQVKDDAFETALTKIADRGKVYEAAIVNAKNTSSTAISAPGFKKYVLDAMQSIVWVYVAAAFLHCRQSWLESVLDKGFRAMAALGGAIAKFLGVAADFAGKIIDAGDDALDFLKAIIKWAPYAALGVGGYFVYDRFIRDRMP